MEGLPSEDLNPFELDDEDDVLPSGAPSTHTHSTSSPRRAQKRPRSPTDTCRVSTPPSGQWAMDDGGIDDPDEISLSVTDPRPTAQGERTSPPWLVQVCQRLRVLVFLRCRVSLLLLYGNVFLRLSY